MASGVKDWAAPHALWASAGYYWLGHLSALHNSDGTMAVLARASIEAMIIPYELSEEVLDNFLSLAGTIKYVASCHSGLQEFCLVLSANWRKVRNSWLL